MALKRYLIIGDGAAGMTAAETLRASDPAASIAIISDDPHPAYYRAALTNYLLGELREDQLWATLPDFYSENRIVRVLSRVLRVDTSNRRLWEASSHTPLEYDALLLASGARSRPAAFAGSELDGVMGLRSIADARNMLERLNHGALSRALVLGGGPLGLEWAHGMFERGAQVTLLERAPRLLPRVLDEVGSDLLAARLRHAGINVVLGEEVQAAYPAAAGSRQVGSVVTKAGTQLPADFVALALGVVNNTEFLEGSGVSLDEQGAVRVDRGMRTSQPSVYAAGDVAVVDGESLKLWAPAKHQGRIAAVNMLGGNASYDPGPHYFATRLFDLDFASVGRVHEAPGDETLVDFPRGTGTISYRKLVLKGSELVGFQMLGERRTKVRQTGRALLRVVATRANVGGIKHQLLTDDFDFEGWLETRRLMMPVAPQAAAPGAPPAQLRKTQAIALMQPPKAARHGAPAKPATTQLPPSGPPSETLEAIAPSMAPSSRAVASRTVALPTGQVAVVRPMPRQTRMLSIGLSAEAPAARSLTRPSAASLHSGTMSWPLEQALTRLGSAPECAIRLEQAAPLHAEIVEHAGGLYLRHLAAQQGTWVNGAPLSSPHRLAEGDQIVLGSVTLRFVDPNARRPNPSATATAVAGLEVRSGRSAGLFFALGQAPIWIGQSGRSQLRLSDQSVGWEHAQVRWGGQGFLLSDLGTGQGTYLAGQALPPRREVPLQAEQSFYLGSVELCFTQRQRQSPAALLAPRARLLVAQGQGQPAALELGQRATVGSAPGCDLVLIGADPKHLELEQRGAGYVARDVSQTGTFRAGRALGTEFQALSGGDLLLLGGGLMLRFEESA